MAKTSSIRWAGRGLVAFTAMVWLACGSDGEVAMTMMCPSGETCSDTLTGARFTGTSPSDSLAQHLPTALGGHQRVRIANAELLGGPLPAWHAVSSDPDVFVIESQTSSSVTLLGVGAGSAFIRVLDSADHLIDRIRFGVQPIERAELRSPVALLVQPWEGPFVYMHGAEERVVAALLDVDGGRLVDQDASFVAADGVLPSGWDAATVTFPDTGDVWVLSVDTGAGARLNMEAQLVDRIDQIQRFELVSGEADEPLTMRAGGSASACFISLSGDAAVVGSRLSLADHEFVVGEVSAHGALTCVALDSGTPGEYTLLLSGPGATLSFDLTVTAPRT